ncbi:TPA: iron-sulfur cluster repair protein DnrN [Neisseria meningitidis]|uniref:iron-sulfur cluster repair protein DnrN n=1 Tax=Neisseria meningitidis TaxID=487 RepID=UPI000200D95E|nr:iron-sulfur cluster repair protein DnrN [Neisseria meningitidis]ADY99811.1 NO-dependent regulator DnrN [Neisseria meningitidis M01-240355]MBG8637938.1 iron-sulfur cluster repair protein DnrN [Neisseria meningitidis]MBG8655564.1 iron-sulfur cluster repair protein DnrN [Neisseria meningitidis]MBG8657837.1 iron-sulfur cluster repair protein DnrN [Neisseria meningitidis]MBG8664350.1 iron-sulfur cluster repair protein DnrN [Neisseria meningitidis]
MTDFSVWETAPFGATVDHILQRYHNVHRAQFEELVPLAQKVAQVHADTFPAEIAGLLAYMQNELLMHMMKEERMLFPMINQGIGRGAAMPISVMMHEHEEHDRAIARLKELTDDFQVPEGACGSWTRLYALAKEMVEDLNDHIHLENDILFARVLDS